MAASAWAGTSDRFYALAEDVVGGEDEDLADHVGVLLVA